MASAIFDGLRSNKSDLSCAVFEPDEKLAQIWKSKGAIVFESAHALLQSSRWLVLAIKPQVFNVEKEHYKSMEFVGEGMISVMAGIPSSEIQKLFPEVAVVRTMPNTPLMLKQGMVALAKGSNVLDEQMEFVASLFRPVAKTMVVDESQIDGVTAISGSGPAYLFYLTEHLVDHCIDLNLNADDITLLWSQTLRGAAEMLEYSGMSATQLREQVTSPGGTTQAALESMMSCELGQNFAKGVLAAHQRSLELSQ